MLVLEVFSQQCVFEKECIVTVVTPEKCSINGYHRHRKNLLTKGNMVLFCTTFQLFFFFVLDTTVFFFFL